MIYLIFIYLELLTDEYYCTSTSLQTDMNFNFLVVLLHIFQATCQQKNCDSEGDFLVDDSDCTKFFKCSHGVSFSLQCPDGLRYLVNLAI